MTRINDLDLEVLYRILCFASNKSAKDIDNWKQKLILLQVCTTWYDSLKSCFPRALLFYSLDDESYPKVDIKSCIYYADNDIVCRSNLGIITGHDKYNCDYVSNLKVKVAEILHISQYAHVLNKLLTLGVGYWLNLSSLVFNDLFNRRDPLGSEGSSLDNLSLTISKHICEIQNMAPNITHLGLDYGNGKMLFIAFLVLINHYAQRLQRLHIDYPIRSPLPLFSTELASLSLNLFQLYTLSSFFLCQITTILES